jgi:hypothetical protein
MQTALGRIDPKESFESADIHKKRTYKLDYLNGNGQFPWDIESSTGAQANNYSSLSTALDSFRRKSIVGARYHKDLSDARILYVKCLLNYDDCLTQAFFFL